MYRKSLRCDSPKLVKKYVSSIKEFLDKRVVVTKSALDDFIEMLITNQVNEVVRLAKVVTNPLGNAAKSRFRNWYSNVEGAINYNYNSQSGAISSAPITIPDLEYSSFERSIGEELSNKDFSGLLSAISSYDVDEGRSVIDDTHPFYDDFLYPTKANEYYGYLSSTVDDHAKNMSVAITDKNYRGLREEINELNLRFAELLPQPHEEVTTVSVPEIKSPLFSEIEYDITNFIETNGKHSKETGKNYLGTYKWFVPMLGDYKLSEITEDVIEEVWNNLRRLPSRSSYTHYFDKATKERVKELGAIKAAIETIWEQYNAGDEDRLEVEPNHKIKSFRDHRELLQAIFNWAGRNGFIQRNPMKGARLATSGNPTPRTELPTPYPTKIVNYCIEHRDPVSWAILLMAYHGFRNSEITALTHEDVVIEKVTKVPYIWIKKGKTIHAKRRVPIHKVLIKAGFIKYIEEREGLLFNMKSSDLTLMFNKLRGMFDIPLESDEGERLNLYSLRHNVTTQLQYMDNCKDHHVYALVGHAPKGAEVTFNYTSARYLELQSLINQVHYKEVISSPS